MCLVADWTFLTNHARAPLCIAHDPGVRLRDIAASLGITERSAHGIVADLAGAGYRVSESDIVEVAPRSRELIPFAVARAEAGERPVPAWLEVIPDKMRILVHALPARAQIDTLVQEQLITEYYSK